MTAVLSATDPLGRDRIMSLDDTQVNYSSSSVDWRAKYEEVADMLAETRAELDDFHHASKELEAELESELQRTEKAQQDLRVKVARAEIERDDWKAKFMSLQTTHNTTTTSLQRELDQLRQEHQRVKVQLRELEMGNDDLERTERAVSSTLADTEAKYSKALEEKILLEHELLDKANLEEQCQRLKDELRDATAEISVLKDQLATASQVAAESSSSLPARSSDESLPSEDDLLHTAPPPDMSLSELGQSEESLHTSIAGSRSPSISGISRSDEEETPRKRPASAQARPLRYPGAFQSSKLPTISTPPSSSIGIPRSSTLPSVYGSPRSPRTPVTPRTPMVRNPSVASTSSTASKNRGVQMVSEMRARVKNLEQKIHTRVPRLRMGSITGRPNPNALVNSSISTSTTLSASTAGKSISGKSSWDISANTRRSVESQRSGKSKRSDKGGDSSGWVLIMEDSPSPPKNRDKERRRTSSPLNGGQFRPAASTSSASPTFNSSKSVSLYQSAIGSGLRRPQSRLSAGSTTTTSSIPTPSSRPTTPTFLPVPTSGLPSLKRSTAAPSNLTSVKRSSLGSSTSQMPPPPIPSHSNNVKFSSENSTGIHGKALPSLPDMKNVTIRTQSKLPSSSSLGQSRIGRPSGGATTSSRRRSSEDADRTLSLSDLKPDLRPRAGSNATYSKT